MKRSPVIHPFLISIHPVISLFAINFGNLAPHNAVRALIISEAIAIILFVILLLITKKNQFAGLLVSLFFIFTYSFDSIHENMEILANGVILRRLYFLPVWLILFAVIAALLWRKRNDLNQFTSFFNITAGVLLSFPVYGTLWYGMVLRQSSIANFNDEESGILSAIGSPPILKSPVEETPDIYYIVLDAYTRQDTLEEFFDYDNLEFIKYLRDTGFYVADESQANYQKTKLAVSAVTNFQYLDNFADYLGRGRTDQYPLTIIGQNPRIARSLKNIGYTIVSISPWLDYLSLENADYNLVGGERSLFLRSEFESILIDQTPFPEVLNRLFPRAQFGNVLQKSRNFIWDPNAVQGELERQKIHFVFNLLANMQDFPSPKFVFVHLLSPHHPFVFGPDGEERYNTLRLLDNARPEDHENVKGYYRDEITYLNKLLMQAIEDILNSSETPPIIIIQGDHGLRLYLGETPEDSCLKESMTILNAIYLPDGNYDGLYPTISPVNTFRIVLDKYFGTDLGLEPDRSYFAPNIRIYDFIDVTNEANTCNFQSVR